MNSLNSPLSLSKEMPFELLCNLIKLGCFGGSPSGVDGAWLMELGVTTERWPDPDERWGLEVKLLTVAASITLLSSISCSWFVSRTSDSSFTWNRHLFWESWDVNEESEFLSRINQIMKLSFFCGVTWPAQVELQMLVASRQLLNKGQGPNFGLYKYRLGIRFFLLCWD